MASFKIPTAVILNHLQTISPTVLMFSYHGTKLLCLGYYLHEIMYMYSGFFNNGVLRSLQTVALSKKLKISKALKSLHRFSFNKQTAEFSAILCNRDRAIRLSLKDTVIKCIPLKQKQTILSTGNIQIFITRRLWSFYRKKLTNKIKMI